MVKEGEEGLGNLQMGQELGQNLIFGHSTSKRLTDISLKALNAFSKFTELWCDQIRKLRRARVDPLSVNNIFTKNRMLIENSRT